MSEQPSASRRDAFDALRNPYVRAFALGKIASYMGAQIISVAIGWELYERTGDPWALGLVGVVELAPVFGTPGDLKYASALLILILLLMVRPQGILGRSERVG